MNTFDRTQKYIIEFDEDKQRWYCTREDLQKEGSCGIANLKPFNQDLAPALAMMDCAGYDIAVIGEQLGLWPLDVYYRD